MYIDQFKIYTSQSLRQAHSSDARFMRTSIKKSEDYSDYISRFSQITESAIYVLDNREGAISTTAALELLHAMLAHKITILLDTPVFAKSTSLLMREIILNKLNKILISDITQLDDQDLYSFLSSLSSQTLNYTLTKHETTLILSQRKMFFRQLLMA